MTGREIEDFIARGQPLLMGWEFHIREGKMSDAAARVVPIKAEIAHRRIGHADL